MESPARGAFFLTSLQGGAYTGAMVNWFKISRFFVFLVPLSVAVVTITTLFPFIVGKDVFFRTVVDLALISFLLGLLFQDTSLIMWRRLLALLHKPLVVAISVFARCFFSLRASLG